MFSVNDYVVYGSEGVCQVESIGHPGITGLDEKKSYYTLSPVYRSGKIYTPVDSTILMRSVMTKEEVNELIGMIDTISGELEVPRDIKQANLYYRDLVRTYKCANLISIIKYVTAKQRAFSAIRRNMPAVDVKFLKIAEDMLCSEFGFVLGIDPKEIRSQISECFEKA